ncbi:hypothetical protein RV06_GL001601 [Enterococcus haemoperoxidus]|nr:hypothetical protein RV06_GL001601 [Enterococcus haemoperoxidus]
MLWESPLPNVKAQQKNNQTEKITITFINDNKEFYRQVLDKGTIPLVPENPEPGNNQAMFNGWFTEPTGGEKFDFNKKLTYSTTVFAQFSEIFLVQYKNNEGQIIDSKEVAPGKRIPKSEKEITPPAGEFFTHWSEEGDEERKPFNFDDEKASRNLVLIPNFSKYKLVLFSSEGTQVDPQYVLLGDQATKPTNPEKEGYSFSHWSTKKGGEIYDFNSPITGNLTLYAVFTPENVNVTLVYWTEVKNLVGDPGRNLNNYKYSSSKKIQALAGSEKQVDKSEADSNLPSLAEDNPLKYAEFNFSSSTIVRGDGTSVVNVYYKRSIYTYTFDLDKVNATLVGNGKNYYGNGEKYVMKAKFDQNIKGLWPSNKTISAPYNLFESWTMPVTNQVTDPVELFYNLIPSSGSTYTSVAKWTTNLGAKRTRVFVYFESVSGTGYEAKRDYDKEGVGTNLVASAISGLTYSHSTTVSDNKDLLVQNFYYKRNSYLLKYDPLGGTMDSSEMSSNKKFEQEITEPKAPQRLGYKFIGWYYDSSYIDKVNFTNLKMPSNELTLFAKWESTKNTVRYLDGLNGKELLKQTYGDNEYVTFPADYVKGETLLENKGIFNGWFWDINGTGFEFAETIPVTKDIDLYARWIRDEFRVTYDLGEGSGTAPIDTEYYELNQKAILKDGATLSPPEGKVFAGWKDQKTEKIHYPGNFLLVSGNMKLIPVFVYPNELTQVIYHAGDYVNSPEDISLSVIKNSLFTTAGELFEREGKNLIGWSKELNGKKDFELEQEGIAVGEEHIDLYAVWENKLHSISFLASDHGSLNIEGTNVTWQIEDGTTWGESKIIIPKTIPDKGYRFVGWEPELPKDKFVINKDMVFKAKFELYYSTLNIEFLDEEGVSLHLPIKSDYLIGSIIDLTKEQEVTEAIQEIKKGNYELYKRPEKETEILIEEEEQTVQYQFKGKLFVQSSPNFMNFGRKSLGIPFIKVEKAKYDKPLIVWDNRKNGGPWDLTATLKKPLTSQEDPSKTLPSAIHYKVSDKKTVVLSENEPQSVAERTHETKGQYNVSNEWDNNESGLFLEVPSGDVLQAGGYRATILWQVEQTP